MKNILYLILCIIIFNIFLHIRAEKRQPNYIAPEFKEIYDEYINTCNELDIDTYNLRKLDSIAWKDMSSDCNLGLYTTTDIYIDPLCDNTITSLEVVLYHEFGHALGLKHCDCLIHIMNSSISRERDIDTLRIPIMNLIKQKYFEDLKQL